MEAKKIFSKLNIKNYNDELEEILEGKLFSFDVKNLLLSMLYKIENAYKDYMAVKIEVIPLKELVSYVIKTIQEKCFSIEFMAPDKKEPIQVDKTKGKIICYPNELSLLSAIWYMGEENAPIVTKYPYTKEAIQEMLSIGSNMSIVEVLRDFNGWSWDIDTQKIENIKLNILYQSLLLIDGKRLLKINIESNEKNSILIKKNKKELTTFFDILANVSLNLYKKENKEIEEKLEKIKKEKEEKFELIKDKKAFIQNITDDKKRCLAEIEKIDKISNDKELLKKEYQERNANLPNKEKIFSISHLSDRLEKERETLLKQIQNYNKMIEPKEFVKEKEKIEQEIKFLQEEKNMVECCNSSLEYCKKIIEKLEEKAEIIEWIYKIRYYCQIPFDKETTLKDIKGLQKSFKEVIKAIIKKAQEHKIWDVFTENPELTYIVIKELFYSKMINFENVNILCEYKDRILYVKYYDGNILETKAEFKLENVKIKRKIKLFI